MRVILHADWLAQMVFAAMAAAIFGALVAWAVQQVRLRRGQAQGLESALAFLSGLVITAPFLGLTRAAYELMKACLGLVNLRPTPDLVALAPAFAEAAMAILLGALTAAVAAAARGHLLMTRAGRPPATEP
jgi:hypothetical protein